jgi:hypothetical protein
MTFVSNERLVKLSGEGYTLPEAALIKHFFMKYYPEKVDKWHTMCYDLANWLL